MKTVFITLPETFIARNIFFTDFWPTFLELQKENKIVILTKPEKEITYKEIFEKGNVEVVSIKFGSYGLWGKFVSWLAINGIDTHTNEWEKMRARERGTGLIHTFIKHFYTKTFGNLPFWKDFIRKLFISVKPEKSLVDVFNKYNPDIVFLTSLTNYDFDIRVGTLAKQRGVFIVGMPRSWDNFTSHGLIRVVPDFLIVENKYLYDLVNTVQNMRLKEENIFISGLPHYDIYKKTTSPYVSREEFLQKLNISQDKKVILYGAMGDYFVHEGEIGKIFERLSKSGKIDKDMHLLYRAHPRFEKQFEKMVNLSSVTPDSVAMHIGRDQAGKEIGEDDTKHLINSVLHSEFIITSASTMAIDATSLGKPVICIAYDLNIPNIRYWMSAKRFYDKYTHFEDLVSTGGVKVVRNDDELANAINSYTKNKDEDKEGRVKLLETFVNPFDGKSGVRLAEKVSDIINKYGK